MLLPTQLLESMTSHMVESRSRLCRGGNAGVSATDTSQLLIVVSDGRCLGDRHKVQAAVRRARDAQLFLVFVVLDNPNKEVHSSAFTHSSTYPQNPLRKLTPYFNFSFLSH